jgi:hypothetical protein
LDGIHLHATDNNLRLADQKKKMAEVTKEMKLSFCATVSILLIVIAIFIATYVLIRLAPSSNSTLTCPVKKAAWSPPVLVANVPALEHVQRWVGGGDHPGEARLEEGALLEIDPDFDGHAIEGLGGEGRGQPEL